LHVAWLIGDSWRRKSLRGLMLLGWHAAYLRLREGTVAIVSRLLLEALRRRLLEVAQPLNQIIFLKFS
jgi:hypothetical protein